MALSTCRNNSDSVSNNSVLSELRDNIGRVVTIFTSSGGCSGNGFTGLLTAANSNTCRLVTSVPSAPRHPFGVQNANSFFNEPNCRDSRFGTVIVIPLNQICAVVSNEI